LRGGCGSFSFVSPTSENSWPQRRFPVISVCNDLFCFGLSIFFCRRPFKFWGIGRKRRGKKNGREMARKNNWQFLPFNRNGICRGAGPHWNHANLANRGENLK